MPSNAPAQEWNATRYAANARFVSDLGQPVLDLLKPQPGERILDLGCGDGALTEKVVAAGRTWWEWIPPLTWSLPPAGVASTLA